MEVRLAEAKDIPDICRLYNEFYMYNAAQQPLYYRQAEETGNYPRNVLESGTEDLLVAAEGGGLIGLLHIMEEKTPPYPSLVRHHYAVIMELYVTEAFRGRGAGRELLEAAKQWAKARELDYLELNVLEENKNGIRFYLREKFKAVSQTMRYTL
jgi:ribosomal protein S18 acetylase RimI-like enzyme